MTTEILAAFSRLSRPGLASLFTDEKLSQIARSRKISEKKVANIIALHLLHNFSVGPSFLNQSKILRTTYDTLNVRYRAIVKALLQNEDVEFLPVIEEWLGKKSYYGTRSKEKILRREIQRALLATDEIISFPGLYRIFQPEIKGMQLATNVNAERLFGLIDTKEKPKSGDSPLLGRSYRGIPAEEGQQLARFFYKHVALYKEGKILTWKDLVEQWVKLGADRELVSRVENALPLNWLRGNTFFSSPKKGTPTFQAFVYNQTIEVLEDLIQIKLDVNLRKKLFEQMKDEKFRMNLVFYLAHPDYLLRKVPTREEPTYHWLRAIRRFLFLRDQRNFDSVNGTPLFHWAFYAESVPLAMAAWEKTSGDFPHVPIKWDVNRVIEAISDLEKDLPGVAFQKSALELVYILEKDGNEFKGKTDFILKLSQSKYAEVLVGEIEGFFRSGGFDKAQYVRNLQTLELLLDEMKTLGKSKRFLPLLGAHDLSGKIDLAKQAILQVEGVGMETEQLLAIFQNVLEDKIDLNLLTAANTYNGIPADVKRKAFTGPLPSQVHSELPRMRGASTQAREYQSKYGFTPVETFQCYLWMLSQDEESLKAMEEILGRIEVFIGCSVEKQLVLSLMQAKINTSEVVGALKELYTLRDAVMREHAEKEELPEEVSKKIQDQMCIIMNSDQTREYHFHVHPAIEMYKYIASGFLYLDLDHRFLAPFMANFQRKVQTPFGQITSLKRLIRGGWRFDRDLPIFELSFVNHEKQLRKHLEVPLQIKLEEIANKEGFFQWVSEMAGEVCPDLEVEPAPVPDEFSRFEEPVRGFLQQLKVTFRKTVVGFARPDPLAETTEDVPCRSFSTDECPKGLASLIIQGKLPAPFLADFDDGHEKKKLTVHCKNEERDPFCITFSVALEGGNELAFPVQYLHALTRNESDFQILLELQLFHLKAFYYEHVNRKSLESSSSKGGED